MAYPKNGVNFDVGLKGIAYRKMVFLINHRLMIALVVHLGPASAVSYRDHLR